MSSHAYGCQKKTTMAQIHKQFFECNIKYAPQVIMMSRYSSEQLCTQYLLHKKCCACVREHHVREREGDE